MNENQDMQKRILIFFVVVSVLLISFSFFSQYFLPKEPKKEQKTQNIEQKQIINPVGNIDLILNNERVASDNLKDIVKINTNYGYVEFSKIGGRVVSNYWDKYKIDLVSDLSKQNRIFLGEIISSNPLITKLLNFSKYEFKQDGNKLIFSLNTDSIKVEKIYTINEDGTISFSLKSAGLENQSLLLLSGISIQSNYSFGHSGAIIKTDKEIIKIDKDFSGEKIITDKILWAGEENKYFLQMFAIKNGCSQAVIKSISKDNTVVLQAIPSNIEGFGYVGPKLYSLLGKITEEYLSKWNVDLDLRASIDFGFFGIVGKPLFLLLHFFYSYIPNWGVAIIILTILIRLLFFPLNHKSLKAMKKMADLAPEIEKLKKKYAKDPQKLQEEIMKLYAQAGANPMSGCLPILVQIPVFIALYNVLMVTVELKNAPFMLWIQDLSEKDPYYILPILMGLSMVAQQWITPSSDKNQKIIMYIMAGVFTFMFMNFPSGLVLYWLVNNLLGILQSFIINKTMKK